MKCGCLEALPPAWPGYLLKAQAENRRAMQRAFPARAPAGVPCGPGPTPSPDRGAWEKLPPLRIHDSLDPLTRGSQRWLALGGPADRLRCALLAKGPLAGARSPPAPRASLLHTAVSGKVSPKGPRPVRQPSLSRELCALAPRSHQLSALEPVVLLRPVGKLRLAGLWNWPRPHGWVGEPGAGALQSSLLPLRQSNLLTAFPARDRVR